MESSKALCLLIFVSYEIKSFICSLDEIKLFNFNVLLNMDDLKNNIFKIQKKINNVRGYL